MPFFRPTTPSHCPLPTSHCPLGTPHCPLAPPITGKSTECGDEDHGPPRTCSVCYANALLCTPHRQSYRDLIVWKKSMALVFDVYRCTQAFPKIETYGLTSQLRRAAVSIPSNIAEGQARLFTGEFKQFLGNARGSLVEVETQILIAKSLGYLELPESENILALAAEVGRILNGLLASLSNRK